MFTLAIVLIGVGALINGFATLAISLNLVEANAKIKKLEGLALDTYKGHHEHILLANRDKNCCEEVSSKTDPKFIREGPTKSFTTEARKESGCCTRTEATIKG